MPRPYDVRHGVTLCVFAVMATETELRGTIRRGSRLLVRERPPLGGMAQGEVAEEIWLGVDGETHRFDDGSADGFVGLAGGTQLEQVVAFTQAHSGEYALEMGVGDGILGYDRVVTVQGLVQGFGG